MQFKRSERVSELLRHEISKYVQEIQDPRLGFVTITAVHITEDLTEAKIYYSVYGSEEEKEVSSQILKSAVPSIRHTLGRKLESLKKMPRLAFLYDDTPEHAQKITSILNQLAHEKQTESPSPENNKEIPS